MTGIYRRGQKIECIAEIQVFFAAGKPRIRYQGPIPVSGEIYTVGDFVESGFLDGKGPTRMPGVTLLEIPMPSMGSQSMGWPLPAFRPLIEDESKTDISELVKFGRVREKHKITSEK